ncbi:MAG: dihydroorotate dehydrogenase electron transfer subunit [Bacteroidaceae bacterium]|nr:dihydroorotate dehydrogenase electron transfer subunit [Bacteroidaceae bacterium]
MTHRKYILDLTLTAVEQLNERCALLRATDPTAPLPPMQAGQFAQLRVDNSPHAFLRRPISIHNVDRERNEVWFLVQIVGKGTKGLAQMKCHERLNAVLPLGNGFTLPERQTERVLLVGGGVGVAPLLLLGKQLSERGVRPTFLLGARSEKDLLQTEHFRHYGDLHVSTEDGSLGERGFVTQHPLMHEAHFDRVYVCGPKPMMVAVAHWAKSGNIWCEVSLENRMACGIGACLCCVEDTSEGHVCVCTEGPVFNIEQLKWQI